MSPQPNMLYAFFNILEVLKNKAQGVAVRNAYYKEGVHSEQVYCCLAVTPNTLTHVVSPDNQYVRYIELVATDSGAVVYVYRYKDDVRSRIGGFNLLEQFKHYVEKSLNFPPMMNSTGFKVQFSLGILAASYIMDALEGFPNLSAIHLAEFNGLAFRREAIEQTLTSVKCNATSSTRVPFYYNDPKDVYQNTLAFGLKVNTQEQDVYNYYILALRANEKGRFTGVTIFNCVSAEMTSVEYTDKGYSNKACTDFAKAVVRDLLRHEKEDSQCLIV